MKTKRNILTTFAAIALMASTACFDLDVGNLNNPDLDDLANNPTPSGISAAATGLLVGNRTQMARPNGYVSMLGILGRESYNFDAADPRFITEMLGAPQLDPGSPAFGGNFWSLPYRNIRHANVVLSATDKVEGMSDEDKEAVRGFTKTVQALDFLIIYATRYDNGAPVDVGGDPQTLAPIVTGDEVLTHIATLLDDAETHLGNGGAAFPFTLSTGFAGFDTPADFIPFNRALAARIDLYEEDYASALTNIAASFMVVDAAQLDLGVYHTFGTGPGDRLNELDDPNLFVHPAMIADAEAKGDATPDDRVQNKTQDVESRTVLNLTSDKGFTIYTITAPVPIIRNEELILIRAEALMQTGDLPGAEADLDFIRVNSGGLQSITIDASNVEDQLLQQRRYSLMFEGGHRWIDTRRFDRLDDLALDDPTHSRHVSFPIPLQETDARQ